METNILDDNFQSDPPQSDRAKREEIRVLKIGVNSSIGDVKIARGTLIVMGLMMFVLLYFRGIPIHLITFFIPIAVALIYLLTAFFVKSYPTPALVIGFSVFIVYFLFGLFVGAVVPGFGIFSIPIIYFLVKGISAAKQLEQHLIRLSDLGFDGTRLEAAARLEIFERT